jgi:hypothetical protein
MSYVVVAPLALAKDQNGDVCYHYEGSVISWLDDKTAEHLLSSGIVKEIAGGVAPAVEAERIEADALEGEAADRPAQTAPKHVWVDYAVAQGLDPVEAEKLTKLELISLTES